MERYSFRLLFFLATLMTLAACGPTLTPFTQDLYDRYRWSDSELQQIQFYLSHDIVLKREVIGGSSEIISGEIRVEDGRRIEQIAFRRGTPGVLLFRPKDDRFAISFEDGGETRFLMFGPNPKMGDRYALLAAEWNRRQGAVTYDGRKFKVEADDALASLMVDLKRLNKVDVNSRVARGRRVN